MHLLAYLVLAVHTIHNLQAQTLFIGHGSNHYFALRMSPNTWDWGINNCHTRGLMPGSIPTEGDHRLITGFLNTSAEIENENRFLWVAATDHKQEGKFQWLWNSEDVNVGWWAPEMPSINRTANCLAINRQGEFEERHCFDYLGERYFVLCEAPKFNQVTQPAVSRKVIEQLNSNSIKFDLKRTHPSPFALTVIGQVGNKIYFVDDTVMSWTESLDLCHSSGMRLATPEEPEQYDFLHTYARRQAQEGEPNPIYYIGGTDRLALSCLKSNTEYRWIYSGNTMANQTGLIGNQYYYQCLYITPGGLTHTNCVKGGGAFCHPLCEISV